MGGSSSKSSSSSSSSKNTTYGNTTTSNPYVTSSTTNNGTVTKWAPGSAMESINNFVNSNINNLLNEYLNPSIDSAVNQARMNQYNKIQKQNLENNIIAPLAERNMIRSSQATDLYNNLSNQAADYANTLLANSQADTGNMVNNLMNYVLQGWNVINGNQAQSLNTSQGNATVQSNTSGSSSTRSFST
jgi:hypothetical protein